MHVIYVVCIDEFCSMNMTVRNLMSHVLLLVSLPIFSSHPNNVQADVFSDITLTCGTVGYGIVALIWKRAGGFRMPITAVQVNSVSHDAVDSTLLIKRVNGYYAGEYYCIAENIAGKVKSKTASLLVQGMYIRICTCVCVCVCACACVCM